MRRLSSSPPLGPCSLCQKSPVIGCIASPCGFLCPILNNSGSAFGCENVGFPVAGCQFVLILIILPNAAVTDCASGRVEISEPSPILTIKLPVRSKRIRPP